MRQKQSSSGGTALGFRILAIYAAKARAGNELTSTTPAQGLPPVGLLQDYFFAVGHSFIGSKSASSSGTGA